MFIQFRAIRHDLGVVIHTKKPMRNINIGQHSNNFHCHSTKFQVQGAPEDASELSFSSPPTSPLLFVRLGYCLPLVSGLAMIVD